MSEGLIGGLGPDKGFGVFVGNAQVSVDGGFQSTPYICDEQGIRRQLEGFGNIIWWAKTGLQPEGPPAMTDGGVAQTGALGHGSSAPVGGIPGRGLQGQRQNPLRVGVAYRSGATTLGKLPGLRTPPGRLQRRMSFRR